MTDTPTDDEREALAVAIRKGSGASKYQADLLASQVLPHLAGFRRSEVPEPSTECPKCGVRATGQTPSTFYTHHDETCNGALEEPQGEPSDAQVEAALAVLRSEKPGHRSQFSAMRAALRAAGGAR